MNLKKIKDSASRSILDVDVMKDEFSKILQDSLNEMDINEGYKSLIEDEYLEEYTELLAARTVRDMDKYVHGDTHMDGNFANIKINWEFEHKDEIKSGKLPEFDGIIEMFDNGEYNDATEEFSKWAVEWYFYAFGTYGIKYNWREFVEDLVFEWDEDDDEGITDSSECGKVSDSKYNYECEIGVDFHGTESMSDEDADKLVEMVFPKGYPSENPIFSKSCAISVESEFGLIDRTEGDSVCVYSFLCVANTDNVDKIRETVSEYVSKWYDGTFNVLVGDAEE